MIGLYLCLLNLTEVIGSLVISKLRNLNYKLCILFGQLTMCLGLVLLGQKWMDLFHCEYSLLVMGTGLSLVGLGMVFSFIVVVPYSMQYLERTLMLDEEEASL